MKKLIQLFIILSMLCMLSSCMYIESLQENIEVEAPDQVITIGEPEEEEIESLDYFTMDYGFSPQMYVKSDTDIAFEEQIISLEKANALSYSWAIDHAVRASNSENYRPILLRDLMDVSTIRYAQQLSVSDDPLAELSDYLRFETMHTDNYLDYYGDEEDMVDGFVLGDHNFSDHNYSAVIAYEEIRNKDLMRCAGYASLNASLVSWLYGTDDVITVNCVFPQEDGSHTGHAIAFMNVNEQVYIFDNNYVVALSETPTGIDFEGVGHGADIYTTSYFSSAHLSDIHTYYYQNMFYGGTVINANSSFTPYLNTIFDRDDFILEETEEIEPFVFDLAGGNANLLSQNMMIQMYDKAKSYDEEDMHLAKYAYHTMLVKHPEFYVRSNAKLLSYELIEREDGTSQDLRSDVFYEFMSDKNNIEDILEGLSHIERDSIYYEYHRFMLPQYILLFEKADYYGLPILVQCALSYLEEESYVIYTDTGSYVIILDEEEWLIYDLMTFNQVGEIEGKVTLLMNDLECYYPLMDQDSLKESTKEKLASIIRLW